MIVARVIAFFLLIVAAIVLGRDAIACYDTGTLQFLSGTQLWFLLAADSYQTAQLWGAANLAFVWDPVITTILSLPAFISAGVIGLAIFLLSRPRKQTPSGGGRNNLRRVYG